MRLAAGLAVALWFGASGAAAQSVPPALAEARVRLASGDTLGAYRHVQSALRRTPDAVALRRLQLDLRLAGQGVRRMPVFMRAAHLSESAERLLRVAPGDTTALGVLVDASVWEAVTWHDRVLPIQLETGAAFADPLGARARRDRRREAGPSGGVAPSVSLSRASRAAHERGLATVAEWLAADPGAVRAHRAAMTLATAAQDWPGALAVAERFGRATGDLRADLYRGLAWYRLGRVEAADSAFARALGRMGPAERDRYESVRPLLPLDLHAAYDAAPGPIRRSFWALSDPWLLTEVDERRVEHLARVVEADLMLGANVSGPFRNGAARGADTVEGQVWIRYGRPRSRSVRGVDAVRKTWAFGDGITYVFEDPEFDGEARLFSPPASSFGDPRLRPGTFDYVIRDRDLQRTDPQRTQDAPARLLDVAALVSRFRTAAGGVEAVVAYEVPIGAAADPVRSGAYGIAGEDVVGRRVLTHDRAAAREAVLVEAAAFRFRAGGRVRVEVEGDGGDARARVVRDVAPLPGGFAMSDLLLARSVDAEGRGPLVRDGMGIVPAARATFAIGDPVHVVAEVYGLALDGGRSRYTVEAELRPAARRGGVLARVFGEGRGPGVAVRSEAEGDRADEPLAFFLDVGDQEPGRYALTVTVTDLATGAAVSAGREVTLE